MMQYLQERYTPMCNTALWQKKGTGNSILHLRVSQAGTPFQQTMPPPAIQQNSWQKKQTELSFYTPSEVG
jgi:hypothetical protein